MKLTELTGTKVDQEFEIGPHKGRYIYKVAFENNVQKLKYREGANHKWKPVGMFMYDAIISCAPEGIILLPQSFTDKEKRELLALSELGMNWMVKNSTGSIVCYEVKPHKLSHSWMTHSGAHIQLGVINVRASIKRLVKWEDAEPFNIVEAIERFSEKDTEANMKPLYDAVMDVNLDSVTMIKGGHLPPINGVEIDFMNAWSQLPNRVRNNLVNDFYRSVINEGKQHPFDQT